MFFAKLKDWLRNAAQRSADAICMRIPMRSAGRMRQLASLLRI
jgi:hypothetical protein